MDFLIWRGGISSGYTSAVGREGGFLSAAANPRGGQAHAVGR